VGDSLPGGGGGGAEGARDTVFVGTYQIVERLAVGGMAEVFLGVRRSAAAVGDKRWSPANDTLVVIKRILPHLAEKPEFVEAFVREARITAGIRHANVVEILELGQSGGLPFLAMEYVNGSSLKQLVVASRQHDVRIPFDVAVSLACQAAAGLHAAHELTDITGRPYGLVHRDVSPHNLMVDEAGVVKLLDFGIAKAEEGMDHTRTGMLKGKISYMSPEQCRQERLDRRADVFALGGGDVRAPHPDPAVPGQQRARHDAGHRFRQALRPARARPGPAAVGRGGGRPGDARPGRRALAHRGGVRGGAGGGVASGAARARGAVRAHGAGRAARGADAHRGRGAREDAGVAVGPPPRPAGVRLAPGVVARHHLGRPGAGRAPPPPPPRPPPPAGSPSAGCWW
jgi:hypothetical protein